MATPQRVIGFASPLALQPWAHGAQPNLRDAKLGGMRTRPRRRPRVRVDHTRRFDVTSASAHLDVGAQSASGDDATGGDLFICAFPTHHIHPPRLRSAETIQDNLRVRPHGTWKVIRRAGQTALMGIALIATSAVIAPRPTRSVSSAVGSAVTESQSVGRGTSAEAEVVADPKVQDRSVLSNVSSRILALKDDVLSSLKKDDDANGEHGGHSAAINDALVLLGTTVLIVPLMRRLKTSPILGFLAAGIALGPNGLALVRDVGTSKALAELGVVFFLFEMGLELSTSKLKSLGADVFGLGTAQFLITTGLVAAVTLFAGLPSQTAIVIGAGLALSSSAFVLQLLAERGEVGTRYGRAAFGILLFQDLAVVPVLVLTPLLAGSGGASALMRAVSVASVKAAVALSFIVFIGKTVLQPVFRFVAKAQSSEAFIATILFTALGTSALTSGLGLSDTLGAFLAGVMLAETTFRHQVEADIKPFRGLLLGLFFITVGFSIDLQLAIANIGTVACLVTGLLAIKAGVIAAVGAILGLSTGTALRTGLLLSQGGEFAFVIFGLALQVGVLPEELSQLLLLVVALSMALTPLLADFGGRIAGKLEKRRGLIGVRQEDADTAGARDFVLVAGYGRVGQSVCEMLDSKLVRYMAFDMSPSRVIEARGKGLPVFFGDACRPEVLKAAGAGRARAVVVTLDEQDAALRAVQNIRREFGDELEVFCRARDAKHQLLLKAAGATAIVPELLEASLLLGGAVLLSYGTPSDEVNSLIQDSRRSNLSDVGTTSRKLNEIFGSQFMKDEDNPDLSGDDSRSFSSADIAAAASGTTDISPLDIASIERDANERNERDRTSTSEVADKPSGDDVPYVPKQDLEEDESDDVRNASESMVADTDGFTMKPDLEEDDTYTPTKPVVDKQQGNPPSG